MIESVHYGRAHLAGTQCVVRSVAVAHAQNFTSIGHDSSDQPLKRAYQHLETGTLKEPGMLQDVRPAREC